MLHYDIVLFCPGGRAVSGVFNSSVGLLTVQDVNCTGSELGLQECQYRADMDDFCSNVSNTAIVECTVQSKRVL